MAPTIVFTGQNHVATMPFYVSASSTSTGPFTYSVLSGPATIKGTLVTPTGSGTVVIQASEAADAHYTAASQVAKFTVLPAMLTVEANSCSRPFGAANPTFSGTITGNSSTDTLTETFSTMASLTSSAGAYELTPSVSGADLSKYAVTVVPGTVTITQAQTQTTLIAPTTSVSPNQTIVLTAHVTSLTSGTPGGIVTFIDNGSPLQTISVADGLASLMTTLAPGITHIITASSSGDTNFFASSTASGLSITAVSQDFSFITSGSNTQTVISGKTASYGFTVMPLAGTFTTPVTFLVKGLPGNANAVFTPAELSSSGGSTDVQMFIQTTAAFARNDSRPIIPATSKALGAALLLMTFGSRRLLNKSGKRVHLLSLFIVGIVGSLCLTGCGADISMPSPQSYKLSVVASNGTVQHSQEVTLTLQQ